MIQLESMKDDVRYITPASVEYLFMMNFMEIINPRAIIV